MIEFYYDTSKKVNHKQLQKVLERDIKNVNQFFVIVEGDKITIHIDYYRNVGLFDYDFEFCKNELANYIKYSYNIIRVFNMKKIN